MTAPRAPADPATAPLVLVEPFGSMSSDRRQAFEEQLARLDPRLQVVIILRAPDTGGH
jgi:hypothetical protein